jgi:RNA polymerase sigma-70 factor (ECF subfamily)
MEKWRAGVDREESFRSIFRHYYRLVRSFFKKRGFSEEECDDLAQETFIRVHRNLERFRGDSTFETWLFQVTANVYRNELRSRAAATREKAEASLKEAALSRKEPDVNASESSTEDPLDLYLTEERAEVLRQAMEELPPQMRRCVELRVQRDLKYREIAVLMGVSIDTVKAHLFQARQLLKPKLGSYFKESKLADESS